MMYMKSKESLLQLADRDAAYLSITSLWNSGKTHVIEVDCTRKDCPANVERLRIIMKLITSSNIDG